jgi:hypothetical protein
MGGGEAATRAYGFPRIAAGIADGYEGFTHGKCVGGPKLSADSPQLGNRELAARHPVLIGGMHQTERQASNRPVNPVPGASASVDARYSSNSGASLATHGAPAFRARRGLGCGDGMPVGTPRTCRDAGSR